jgi:hypothetical protein
VELVKAVGKKDAIEFSGEKIDNGGAKEFESGSKDAFFERLFLLFEGDDEIELGVFALFYGGGEAGDFEKKKTPWQSEILAKKTVAFEAARAWGKERFIGSKAQRVNGCWRQRSQGEALLTGRLDDDPGLMGENLAVNGGGEIAFIVDVESDFGKFEFVEGLAAGGLEADAKSSLSAEFRREIQQLEIDRGEVLGGSDTEREQGDGVSGLKDASGLFAFSEIALERGAARDGNPGRRGSLGGIDFEPDDGHGRDRREEMRINGLEESLGKAGELGIELEMNAGGEPGEAFEQAFDIGVGTDFAGIAVETEAAGDGGIFFGKLSRHLAEVAELGVIKIYETFVHRSILRCNSRSAGRCGF